MKSKWIAAVTALALMLSLMTGMALPASAADSTPQLTAASTILGLADTGNKSTLKYELVKAGGPGDTNLYYYDEAGVRVIYEDQETARIPVEPVKYQGSAVLSLTGGDAGKLDAGKAKVELLDSNTTHASEIVLDQDRVKLTKTGAGIELTLEEGALEWNNWDYYDGMAEADIDLNSGREWSMMGGDGNGVYEFIFQVSGIEYDGAALAPVTWPAGADASHRSLVGVSMGSCGWQTRTSSGITDSSAARTGPSSTSW